ncbi:MAG: hypothetical protein M3Y18_07400 [Candidatus Eremiobacteraeota bacterium]|nr:hypothetical protein [Candidatus Eremiobacteraeota bacterium]
METTYFTCQNKACAKHRGIFVEGDIEHADCAREVLSFGDESEGSSGMPKWLPWLAVPAGIAAVAGAVQIVNAQRSKHRGGDDPDRS